MNIHQNTEILKTAKPRGMSSNMTERYERKLFESVFVH